VRPFQLSPALRSPEKQDQNNQQQEPATGEIAPALTVGPRWQRAD